MDDLDEIEFEMTTSGDAKEVVITIRSTAPIGYDELIDALDYYIRELEGPEAADTTH